MSVLRIPGSRPILRTKKIEEPQWNDRFHLGSLPNYDPLRDVHCTGYKNIVVKQTPKGRTPTNAGRVSSPRRHPSASKQRPPSRPRSAARLRPAAPVDGDDFVDYYMDAGPAAPSPTAVRVGRPVLSLRAGSAKERHTAESTIAKLQSRILAYWEEMDIPQFHRDTFSLRYFRIAQPDIIPVLHKELEELHHGRAPIQAALKAIDGRELTLHRLEQLEELYRAGSVKRETAVAQLLVVLSQLRMDSLIVVESVLRWRDQVHPAWLSDESGKRYKKPGFIWDGINYLVKMKGDTNYLYQSGLGDLLEFSPKSDPFLVHPAQAAPSRITPTNLKSRRRRSENVPEKAVLPIPREQLQRIRAAEMVILEEAVSEHIAAREKENRGQVARTDSEKAVNGQGSGPSTARLHLKVPDDDDEVLLGTQKHVEIKIDPAIKRQAAAAVNHQMQQALKDKEQSTPRTSTDIPSPVNESKSPSKSSRPQSAKPASLSTVAAPAAEVGAAYADLSLDESMYSLKPLTIAESQLEHTFNAFLDKVDIRIRRSWDQYPELIVKAKNGLDGVWTWIHHAKVDQPVGLAVYHLDLSGVVPTPYIIHLSTLHINLLPTCLTTVVKDIWSRYEGRCIKTNLWYQDLGNPSDYNVWPPVEKAFESRRFKWQSVTNSKNGRGQLMSLPRADDIPSPPKSTEVSVTLQNSLVMYSSPQAAASDTRPFPPPDAFNGLVGNRFMMASALRALVKMSGDSSWKPQESNQTLAVELCSGLADDLKTPLQLDVFEDSSAASLFLGSQGSSLYAKMPAQQICCGHLDVNLNFALRGESVQLAIQQRRFQYVRVRDDARGNCLMVAQNKSHPHPVFFMTSDDEQLTMFVTLADAPVDTPASFQHYLEIFRHLEQVDSPISEVLIPSIEIESQHDVEWPLGLSNNMTAITGAEEMQKLKICAGPQPEGVFKFDLNLSEKSFVIDQPFIFGFTHKNVDSKLDLPLFFTYAPISAWTTVA